VCIVVSAFFIERGIKFRPFSIVFVVTGIGAIGVGLFPLTMQSLHSIFTLMALIFGSVSAILSFRIQAKPLSYVSVLLGILALGSSIVFFPYLGLPVGATDTFLGMAKGSMERWVIYPIIIWVIAFGASLSGVQFDKDN